MAKILIVDDSDHIVTLLSKILLNYGFEIETALSRKELVNILLGSSPDLILMDVRLGGDDGRKLCRDLKANSTYKNIPVILLSGSHDLLESYTDYQADDVIKKPFEIDDLIRKVTDILKRSDPVK